jgi:ribokinase
MSVTIKDIAAIAGVSVTTVSMVINGKDDAISEETRAKVRQIIKQYNFKPYAKALQKSTARSNSIGVLIPRNTDCYSEFITGAEKEASVHGYTIMLCLTNGSAAETEKYLNNLYGKNADGVILYASNESDAAVFSADMPGNRERLIVSCKDAQSKVSAVRGSFSSAAQLVTEHMASLDHKHIALIGAKDDDEIFGDITTGYKTALFNRHIVFRDDIVREVATNEDVAECVRNILQSRNVTAFVCSNDDVAMRVYRELQHFGLNIPYDCSVACVVSSNSKDALFFPPLTAADMRFSVLGQKSVHELIARIEKSRKKKSEGQTVKVQLIKGGSTAPPPAQKGKRIVVVGSMHMDIIVHTSHIPTSGESIISHRTLALSGGKGANQAVGAAKLGGDVYAIGCLGGDDDGRVLYNSIESNGVNTTGVQIIQGGATGKAYIIVARDGESTIVFSQGTNSELKPSVIAGYRDIIDDAEICLLSTEIPWDTVVQTIHICGEHGVKVILKPTVQTPVKASLLKKITYLVPNEKELNIQVAGSSTVEEKAAKLFDSGVENVIVTLGGKGCYLHNAEQKRFFPAADFTAVNTTGAADAFISALAVYLSEGHGIVAAIKFATYAAGISITRDGVQSAMADRMSVEIYSDKYGTHWPQASDVVNFALPDKES